MNKRYLYGRELKRGGILQQIDELNKGLLEPIHR